MKLTFFHVLIAVLLLSWGCAKKTTENVDNIDHSTDRMADQMQEFQTYLPIQ